MIRKSTFLAAAALVLAPLLASGTAEAQQGQRFPQPEGSRQVCTLQYDPVCASRGSMRRTFGNACEAERARYRVEYRGECRAAGRPPARSERPQACTREYAPVCAAGLNGLRTFSNSCEARAAGHRIIRQGRC